MGNEKITMEGQDEKLPTLEELNGEVHTEEKLPTLDELNGVAKKKYVRFFEALRAIGNKRISIRSPIYFKD